MSLRMQIYNELVNKHSGIRERYMEVHCKQTPFSKINSYFVLNNYHIKEVNGTE